MTRFYMRMIVGVLCLAGAAPAQSVRYEVRHALCNYLCQYYGAPCRQNFSVSAALPPVKKDETLPADRSVPTESPIQTRLMRRIAAIATNGVAPTHPLRFELVPGLTPAVPSEEKAD